MKVRTMHIFVAKVSQISLLLCPVFIFELGKLVNLTLRNSCLENPMDGGAWQATVHGVVKSQTQLSDFTFTFDFHALEKEMATHSSILAWRIPGTAEPGGLPSMGLQSWTRLKRLSSSSSMVVIFLLYFYFLRNFHTVFHSRCKIESLFQSHLQCEF